VRFLARRSGTGFLAWGMLLASLPRRNCPKRQVLALGQKRRGLTHRWLCKLRQTSVAGDFQASTQAPQKKSTPKKKPVAATVQTKPVLEPKTIELLKASCARLAAAYSMSFSAEVTYENPSGMGFPLAYTTKSDVVMQVPDKLRVITPGDGPASQWPGAI
jgi:hypothetical protein